jgi:hypothetical protein
VMRSLVRAPPSSSSHPVTTHGILSIVTPDDGKICQNIYCDICDEQNPILPNLIINC